MLALRISTLFFCVYTLTGISVAKCPKQGPMSAHLSAHEFEIPGYDASRGLLAIRPSKVLAASAKRGHEIQIHWSSRDIHFSLPPSALGIGLEDGKNTFTLSVTGDPPAKSAARQPSAPCQDMVPKRIALERHGIEIAVVNVDKRRADSRPGLRLTSTLKIERGEAEAEQVQVISTTIAKACATQMQHGGSTLQGALSIQLESSVLGEVRPPKAVVDGLVNRPFTQCLLRSFKRHDRLWTFIQPATRAYLTIYIVRSKASSK